MTGRSGSRSGGPYEPSGSTLKGGGRAACVAKGRKRKGEEGKERVGRTRCSGGGRGLWRGVRAESRGERMKGGKERRVR
eukprot:718257-Rhodomonas_salina.2